MILPRCTSHVTLVVPSLWAVHLCYRRGRPGSPSTRQSVRDFPLMCPHDAWCTLSHEERRLPSTVSNGSNRTKRARVKCTLLLVPLALARSFHCLPVTPFPLPTPPPPPSPSRFLLILNDAPCRPCQVLAWLRVEARAKVPRPTGNRTVDLLMRRSAPFALPACVCLPLRLARYALGGGRTEDSDVCQRPPGHSVRALFDRRFPALFVTG